LPGEGERRACIVLAVIWRLGVKDSRVIVHDISDLRSVCIRKGDSSLETLPRIKAFFVSIRSFRFKWQFNQMYLVPSACGCQLSHAGKGWLHVCWWEVTPGCKAACGSYSIKYCHC